MKKKYERIGLLAIAFLFLSCDNCEDKQIAGLLDPIDEDTVLSATEVDYRELNTGLTCLDSSFSKITAFIDETSMESDFSAATSHVDYGNYMIAAVVIKDEFALNAMRAVGCLDNLDATLSIDWDTQTVVVVSALSTSGCDESIEVLLEEDFEELPHLHVSLRFSPDDTCRFDTSRTIIVDSPELSVSVTLSAGCYDDNDPDV